MTNIWALTKDLPLKVLLLLWRDQAAPGTWTLDDMPEADFKSVWIRAVTNPGLRAYISTHGQVPGRYSLHLEYPSHDGSTLPGNTSVKEDIATDRVMELLHEHLA
jgi:hypothetical protein